MNFEQTDDRRMLAETLRRYLSETYPAAHRNAVAYEAPFHDPARWAEMAALGVFYAFAPEDRGGMGGHGFDIVTVFEELGRALCPEPVLGQLLATVLLGAAGQDLDPALSGETRFALALGETDAPYDPADVATLAKPDGSGWRVTGRKSVVYGAPSAQAILVVAKRPSGQVAIFSVAPQDVELHGYAMIDGGPAGEVILEGSPAALILEDATALAVLVSDFAVNPEVLHLHISDRDGVIQASTNPYLKGEALTQAIGPEVMRPDSGIKLYRAERGLLEFTAPVRFQARRVGDVRLALDGSGLERTARATLTMLALVFSAAMLAVVAGLWWIIRRHQVGLRRLAWGLKRLQRGQYDFRFDDEIRDEISPAMREFNRLALQLEEHRRRQSMTTPAQPQADPTDWQSDDPDSALDATLDLSRASRPGNDEVKAEEVSTEKVDAEHRVTPLRRHRPS